ncbi:MAG: hypothetical protein R3B99_23525 [Polyangiales bacterium]
MAFTCCRARVAHAPFNHATASTSSTKARTFAFAAIADMRHARDGEVVVDDHRDARCTARGNANGPRESPRAR